MLFAAMTEIKKIHLNKAMQAGGIIMHNFLNLDTDLIVTRTVT